MRFFSFVKSSLGGSLSKVIGTKQLSTLVIIFTRKSSDTIFFILRREMSRVQVLSFRDTLLFGQTSATAIGKKRARIRYISIFLMLARSYAPRPEDLTMP